MIQSALAGAYGDDQVEIAETGAAVVAMLLRKNQAYGSSAFDPIRVFARGDDKLSRLARGHAIDDESFADTIRDLAGYCVLELVARRRTTDA